MLGTSDDNPASGYILSNPSLVFPWTTEDAEKMKEKDPLAFDAGYIGDVQKASSHCEEFNALWNSSEISAVLEAGRPYKNGYMLGKL